MAFFGLTYLGGGDVFTEYTPKSPLELGSVPGERYTEAFDQHVLGDDTSLAEDYQVDGNENMLRGDLHLILFHVLAPREPTAEEMDVFFRSFDKDSTALIDRAEFDRSIANLKKHAANPAQPMHYVSHTQYVDDMTKHRRVEHNPTETYRRPVTTNQEIGWHTAGSTTVDARTGIKRFPMTTTDVSRNEGSQPSNYFGSCH